MDCIIVDDDATSRLITNQFCSKNEHIKVIDEFSSAIDAIKFLNNNSIDLIFLDIHMPTFSGFDFIQSLKNPPKIILMTSDKERALEAFEYKSVVDYLVKPITKERFEKSMEKLFLNQQTNSKFSVENLDQEFLYVNVDKRLVKVHIPSIYLIEAKGDYINIKTSEKNYLVHSTLRKVQDKLPSKTFFKVHRSFIINITEIIDIEDNTVLVRKEVVPVSRSNKNNLVEKLNLL